MKNKAITVLGAGLSGVSLALLANRLGAAVFLSDIGAIDEDTRARLRDAGIPFEEGAHTGRALEADCLLLSSGFPSKAPILRNAAERGIDVVGELDFVAPHLDARVIGITGSNGKTTTTQLVGHLLSSLGYKTAVAGNIGNPIADMTGERFDYIVAELSSFQLYRANRLRLAGAIVTNLAPDHIDWHGSYENYVRAKARILSLLAEDGYAIIQERDRASLSPRDEGTYTLAWEGQESPRSISLRAEAHEARLAGRTLFRFEQTHLLGLHNMENAAMAMAAVALSGGDTGKAAEALGSYQAPPHRCALVLTSDGVTYVDDSKGTNIAATVTALSSLAGRKIVILGGRGKGEDYAGLCDTLKQYAKWAMLIGEASPEIAAALASCGYRNYTEAGDLEGAVKRAVAMAEPDDVVLLSPACTSWDAYRNYGERGDHFAALVRQYAGER